MKVRRDGTPEVMAAGTLHDCAWRLGQTQREANDRTPEVAARRLGQTQREANARTPEVTAARRLGQTQHEANDRHPRENSTKELVPGGGPQH